MTATTEDSEEGAVDSAAGFADAIRRVMRHADERDARVIRWCDEDFAFWPLGDVEFLDRLTHWARGPARELVMVAGTYELLRQRHPRFVQWRRDFGHVITCLEPSERRDDPLPTLWLDAADQVVRVFDRERWRGRVGADRVDRQLAREMLDAITQRGTPAFGASTLGL
jgi:hypothetical protein